MTPYQFSFSLSTFFALIFLGFLNNLGNPITPEKDMPLTFNQKLTKFYAAKDAVDFDALAKRSATDEVAKQEIMEIVSILDGSSKEDLASVFDIAESNSTNCYWVTVNYFNCSNCFPYHCGGRNKKICDAVQVYYCNGTNTHLQRNVPNQGTCC